MRARPIAPNPRFRSTQPFSRFLPAMLIYQSRGGAGKYSRAEVELPAIIYERTALCEFTDAAGKAE